ncbi:MAG TPA: FliM/FliN family flagellar motor switch protein [Pyrinomonadaceae bacterium]|jgi:flagellar motor switch protein FliM|nr:FliM/FliN family flagellar motor switch protein [Pyrinomonadaceae bacterium]
MKTDANTIRADEAEPAPAVDPFAVDLFAGPTGGAGADAAGDKRSLSGEPARAPSWDAALQKVTRDEARLSAMLAAVPASLSAAASAALARVAGRLTHADPGQVSFDFLETREEDLSAARPESPRAFVRVVVEPWEARAVLVVEAAFASAVVDLMLGGDGAGVADAPRDLSTAERAVLEFLCAQLLSALNEEAGEPLFRLEALTDEAGAGGTGRAVVTTVRARVGTAAGVVRVVYGPEALAALDEMRSPLLARGDDVAAKLARYEKLCAGARLSVLVGETEVAPSDLVGLEPGDVVVVERVFGGWSGGAAAGGMLRARVGAGDNVLLSGTAAAWESPDGGRVGSLRLLVEEVEVSEARDTDAGRLRMEDESELGEETAAESGLLDNLLLTVRVELPARRISLEELTRLRAGQILDLDCRATDPVELVADGRPVATGELVDIEGRLGVRVTRLAG